MSRTSYSMNQPTTYSQQQEPQKKCSTHGLPVQFFCHETVCRGNNRLMCNECQTQSVHEHHSHFTIEETNEILSNFVRKNEANQTNFKDSYRQKADEKHQIKQIFSEFRTSILEKLEKIETQFMHSIDSMEGFDHTDKYAQMSQFFTTVSRNQFLTSSNSDITSIGVQVLQSSLPPSVFLNHFYKDSKSGTENLMNGMRQRLEQLELDIQKFTDFKADPILKKNLQQLSKNIKTSSQSQEPFLPNFKEKQKIFTSAWSPIYSVDIMNGEWLIAGEHEKNVLIWDILSGKQLFNLSGHSSFVWSLCCLNKDTLASGSGDKTIRIWQFDQYRKFDSYEVKILHGHSAAVRCILKVNDTVLISGGDDCTIKIWEWTSQSLLRTLSGHTGSVTSLCRNNYEDVISGSKDGFIMVWKWQVSSGNRLSSQCILQIKAHEGGVQTICALSKTEIASGGQDNNIKIWNSTNGSIIRILSGHTGSIWKILKLSDDEIVSTANNSSIKIWNWKTDSPAVRSIDRAHQGDVYNVTRVTNDTIATVGADNKIKLWS